MCMRNCDENGESGSGEQKEEEKIFVALNSILPQTSLYKSRFIFCAYEFVDFVDHAVVRHSFIAMCQFLQHKF